MPKELERKLEREADRKGYTGQRKNRYVYGTMAKIKKEQAERRTSSRPKKRAPRKR